MEKELKEAQQILHDTFGDDWNDLMKTMYEPRVLVAMVKFAQSNDRTVIKGEQEK